MPKKGERMTDEARAKLRATRALQVFTPEHRARMSAGLKGKPWSAARRAAAPTNTPEQRAKISASMKGYVKTTEHRARLSASLRGHPDYVSTAPVKGECAYCLGPANTYDHVIPRGRPGWDAPDNVVLACWPCNRWKGRRTPEEWFAGARRT